MASAAVPDEAIVVRAACGGEVWVAGCRLT